MNHECSWTTVEELDVFKKMETLTDQIWRIATAWSIFGRDTIGKQVVRAADSVCANLVEGDGRFHHKDKLNHLYIARGSIRETAFWLRRAGSRGMISSDETDSLLNEMEAVRE